MVVFILDGPLTEPIQSRLDLSHALIKVSLPRGGEARKSVLICT